MEGDDNRAENEAEEPVDEDARVPLAAEPGEELHPDTWLENVGESDHEELHRGEDLGGSFHALSGKGGLVSYRGSDAELSASTTAGASPRCGKIVVAPAARNRSSATPVPTPTNGSPNDCAVRTSHGASPTL